MKKFIIICLTVFAITFDLIAQWNYGSPISTSAPAPTWQQVQNRPPLNELFDSLSFPYPTNAWFNFLFLGQQTYPAPIGSLGANKIHPYPYQLGLGSGYGGYPNYKALLSVNYKPFNINMAGDTAPFVQTLQGDFFYMGTSDDPSNIKVSLLNDYSDLSVNIKWVNTSNTSKWYSSPLVRGMAYVTMFYNNIKPGVFFPSPDIVKINDVNVTPGMTFTGSSFKIETGGPPNDPNRPQTWMLYCSSSLTVEFSTSANTHGLKFNSDFTGWLRMAAVTYQGEPVTPQQITDKINLLNAYSKFIPVKGTMSASYTSGNSANMQYTFTRYNEGGLTGDSLLMLCLPHHLDMLSNSTTEVLKYSTAKGKMREVRQRVWNMTENMMPSYTFYPAASKIQTVPLQWCDTIQAYVNKDFANNFNRNALFADIYGMGKIFQKLARTIVIADELYEKDNTRYASMQTLAGRMRDTLKIYLGHFLRGGHTLNPIHGPGAWDSVMYDTKYGGLISSLGWDSLNVTCCASYGSAVYNDHHFHYGYPIHAAAIIAKSDPAWFTANSNYYYNRVMDLIRDISNPSRSDGHFQMMRYKDWFEGHSWANGLVPFGDGRNQESSSEAVNAWYGMYIFGAAMNNNNIKNLGALALAQEIRGTQKYYHITVPSAIYPTYYTDKYHIVANLFQLKTDCHTWFPPYASFVRHGIQVIPVTPATEQLWGYNYSRDIMDYTPNGLRHGEGFSQTNTNVLVWQWTTINMAIQAIGYPNEAWNFFPRYGYNPANYDPGQSQANVVYWILTRQYGPIGIEPVSNEIPKNYELKQNYPNPFNPVTNINFSIPSKSFIKLVIYDILGREVALLLNTELNAGKYNYDFDASNLASGVYFYRLESGDFADVKKMMLVK